MNMRNSQIRRREEVQSLMDRYNAAYVRANGGRVPELSYSRGWFTLRTGMSSLLLRFDDLEGAIRLLDSRPPYVPPVPVQAPPAAPVPVNLERLRKLTQDPTSPCRRAVEAGHAALRDYLQTLPEGSLRAAQVKVDMETLHMMLSQHGGLEAGQKHDYLLESADIWIFS